MNMKPGDLVRLTSTRGAVSVGILMEEKRAHGLGLKASSTMLIWKVLLPEGVYSHIREEGWDIEALDEAD